MIDEQRPKHSKLMDWSRSLTSELAHGHLERAQCWAEMIAGEIAGDEERVCRFYSLLKDSVARTVEIELPTCDLCNRGEQSIRIRVVEEDGFCQSGRTFDELTCKGCCEDPDEWETLEVEYESGR